MPAQLPDLISTAGHSQEPPTATTLGSASQVGALASPMPPVGQNLHVRERTRKRAQCLDTTGRLGREKFHHIETVRQRDCISSEAVAIPGANGSALAAAAFSSSGVAPGLMPNLAPSDLGAGEIVGVEDGADADNGVRAPRR